MKDKNREFLAQLGIELSNEDLEGFTKLATLNWDNGIPPEAIKVCLAAASQKSGASNKKSLSQRSSNSSGTPPTLSASQNTAMSNYKTVKKKTVKKPRVEHTTYYNPQQV